ncbi:MAG TPA: hypothetical protein VGS41_17285 [Chthonomonadales bacterium]|nr:hypothetical protein [Chthonomonadales bacterium]
MAARHYDLYAERMPRDYPYADDGMKAALNYYEAYRAEIDIEIEDNNTGYDGIKPPLPGLRLFEAGSDNEWTNRVEYLRAKPRCRATARNPDFSRRQQLGIQRRWHRHHRN